MNQIVPLKRQIYSFCLIELLEMIVQNYGDEITIPAFGNWLDDKKLSHKIPVTTISHWAGPEFCQLIGLIFLDPSYRRLNPQQGSPHFWVQDPLLEDLVLQIFILCWRNVWLKTSENHWHDSTYVAPPLAQGPRLCICVTFRITFTLDEFGNPFQLWKR